ncbi:MAG TPA: ABC transporter permease [Verrucomicrobiae bacterium]|jgi:oligopeptide transport system permease protein|nr:ABC transporter permease [Verrucomicrobiae bacterium]
MYFIRRILFLLPLLLLISVLAFTLVHLMPGGPFDRERGPASPEIERHLRAKYHLDESIPKQYLRYLNGIVHGDFGPSMKYRNHSVNDIILEGLPVSLSLGGLAFCFAMGTGIPLGFFTSVHKGKWQDYAGSFVALAVICVPGLVIGPILIMFFAVKLHWFPVALWGSPWRAILPTLTLGLYFSGRVARLMHEGMLTTLHSEFITTARAKGLGETAILIKHAFRIAVLPVLSYSGPMLADLLTGSFIVENLFQLPGIGVFMVNSSLDADYTMVVGLVLLYAILLLALNLAVDFIHSLLDPRVRYV